MSENKEKIVNNIMKVIFLVLFLIFLTIYFSQSGGYYEFELHKKTVFTEEKIRQFEQDVAEGKDVSIEDYLVSEKKDYNNRASKIGYFVSKNISNYIKKGIEETFKMINKMVE